jgi:hypothetical protein
MGTEYSSWQLSTFSQRTTSIEPYFSFSASALVLMTDPTSGVAFWSVAASLSGAYILGVHKIDRVPFQYDLAPMPESAPYSYT